MKSTPLEAQRLGAPLELALALRLCLCGSRHRRLHRHRRDGARDRRVRAGHGEGRGSDLRSSPSRVEWRPRELGHDGEDRRGDDRLRRARRRADRPQTRRAGHAAGRRRGRAELCGGRAGTRRVVGQVAQRLASRLHTGGGGGKVSEGAAPRGRRVGARWLHIHLQPELYPRAESIHSQSDAVVAATTTTTSARVPHKATGHTCLDPFRRLIACRRALRRLSRCVARVASATRSIVSFS